MWVTNQSNPPGVFVLADAIRIGGGIADTPPPTTLSPSGRPRWEDQAWTYARWVGMPNADNPDPKEMNDVIVSTIYSEWEKDPGEDAVYIAWHTNGYNGYNTVARGTESYIHSFQPTPNSDVLQNYIHTDLLNAIHTGWDAAWPDRGKKTADLGELRLLSTMPGVLIENGYHDNPQDVEAMKDPRFDLLSARAIYHGLVRSCHSRDPNVPLVFLPEPPVHLIARNTGAGEVTLTWQPGPTDGAGLLGDAATSYRVYTSADGFGWSDAIAVPQTTYVLAGLQPGQLVYVRVTGVNAGGESFPTPVMAARADPSGSAAILIVYGFDRIDRYGAIKQYDPPEGYDRRVFADRINAFDYIIQHADAITLPFDSAQRDAVSDGSIGLNGYAVVDWIAGEDQSPQAALSAGDQSALGSFVSGGGALLIGGAKIGSDLQGTSFYANVLHAAFAGSANTHLANAQPGGVWSGLGNLQFDDGTHGTYDVDSPDAFNPIGGATTALVYNGGGPAAIQYSNGSCSRVVYSGVPLETIYPDAVRRSVFARAIDFLSVPDLSIASPADDVYVNAIPAFTGKAAGRSIAVQVSIHRLSDSTYFNGSSFVSGSEIGLTPNGASAWSYSLPPSLNDGAYVLRAWLASPCGPAYALSQSVTFTLDTAPPDVPTLITPTGGISIVAAVAAFAWTGGGDPDGFWLELDGVTTTLNSPELNARLPVAGGLHLWRVQALDRAGNSSGWSLPGEFRTSSLKSYVPVVLRH